jgi:autotransporter-associated beta strand protein
MKLKSLLALGRPSSVALASALSALLASQSIQAGNTWDGGATDPPTAVGLLNSWATATNWNPDGVATFGTGEAIIYGGTVRLTSFISADRTVGSLTFGSTNIGATVINLNATNVGGSIARTLTFDATSGNASLVVDAATTGAKTIQYAAGMNLVNFGTISLTDSLDVTHNGPGNLQLGGATTVISGAGGIVKTGTGNLILGVANANSLTGNTYLGGTTVTGGTVTAAAASALSQYNVATMVNVGAAGTLALNYGSGANDWTSTQLADLFTNNGANFATGSKLSLSTANGAGSYGSDITATLSLIKAGANSLTLSGTNTYTGTTAVNGGTLAVTKAAALPGYNTAANVTVSGTSTLQLNLGGASDWTTTEVNDLLTANAAGFVSGTLLAIDTTNGDGSFGNAVDTSAIRLSKIGVNTLTLTGSNTYAGATVTGGTLKAGASSFSSALGTLGLNVASGSSTFDLNGNNAFFTNIANSTTLSNITNSGSADATLTTGQTSTISSLISDGPTHKLGIIIGANSNSGANLFKLDSANTFSGGITLQGGTTTSATSARMRVDNGTIVSTLVSSPFGTGPITIGTATDQRSGLMFSNLTGTNTVYNDIIVNTVQGTDNTAGNLPGIRIGAAVTNLTFAGKITAGLTNAIFCADGTATVTGQITGTNGLETYNSPISITLNNTAENNNYAGSTIVGATSSLILGRANQIPNGSSVTVNGSFKMDGYSETINGLNGASTGIVDSISGTSTLTVGDADASGSFAGVLQNTAGTLSLIKTGSGTQTLSGVNTYTGSTTVNNGALILDTTGQLKFVTGATSGTGQNTLTDSGAGTITLNGSFVIDTAATDATALTSGSWQIENAASLPGAYGGTFTVVGWTDAGSDTWTKSVGAKNYTFNELDGTVSMVEGAADPYAAWIATYEPNALLPDAASKLPGADPDGDDFSNLMEFVLDGSPVVSSQSIRPNQTVNATDIILTFKRSDASESPVTTQTVQISTDLVDWTTIPAITIGAGDNLPSVGVVENGAAADDITVTIPRSGSLKKFVRLNVVK